MPTIEELDILNFDRININKRLELAADVAPGANTAPFINVEGISANDYIVLNPAQQNAEMLLVQSTNPSTQQITFTTNIALQHRNHEPAVRLVGNQIIVFRAANVDGTIPPDSAFATLGSPIVIDPTQVSMLFIDQAGGSNYWYKFAYYNAQSTFETDLSLAAAVRGGGWGSYCSVDAIRTEAGFEAVQKVKDNDIAAKRAAAESIIDGALTSAGYIMPLQTQNGTPFVPELITWIDVLMSAGFVLNKSYGVTKPSSSKLGDSKITQAEDFLARIQLNDIVLVDSNKQQLLKESLLFGFPGDNSEDPSSDVDPMDTTDDFAYPQVTMNKKF